MKYTLFSLIGVMAFGVVSVFSVHLAIAQTEPAGSVELGISELSPRGEAGGYAMPASGASVKLTYDQPGNGDGGFRGRTPALLPNDKPVHLRWRFKSGSNDQMSNPTVSYCKLFGFRVPKETIRKFWVGDYQATSWGGNWNRILSETTNYPDIGASGFSVVCNEVHVFTGTGHDPINDKVWLRVPRCTDGRDNKDSEDRLEDRADPGCHSDFDPSNSSSYEPGDDREDNDLPTVTLEARNVTANGNWSPNNLSIAAGDEVRLRWRSNEVTLSCRATVGPGFRTGGATDGNDPTIGEPPAGSSQKFEVQCSGAGETVKDSLVISTAPSGPTPVVVLEAKNRTDNGAFSPQDLTIDAGDEVSLRWTSNNTNSCWAVQGPNFATGGALNGTDTSIAEPPAGSSNIYTVRCRGTNGATVEDSIVVTTLNGNNPTVTLRSKNATDNTGFTTGNRTIDAGDQVHLNWTSGNTSSCWVTEGPGFQTGGNTNGTDQTITEPTAGNSERYTVRCRGTNGTTVDSSLVIRAETPATITLRSKNATDNTGFVPGNRTIDAGDQVHLNWTSSRTSSCWVTEGPGFATGGNTNGTDTTITEPAAGNSQTYTVRCRSINGGTVEDSIRINARVAAPTVTIEAKNATDDDNFSPQDRTIDEGDQVHLRWSSNGANSCTATAGPGFATGGNTSGTDTTITEPTVGNSITYTVRCTGDGGNTSDSIIITTQAVVYELPELTADPTIVYRGEETILTWDIKNNPPCTLSGPGVNQTVSGTGSVAVQVFSLSTFRLSCAGGDVEVTVDVLPDIEET